MAVERIERCLLWIWGDEGWLRRGWGGVVDAVSAILLLPVLRSTLSIWNGRFSTSDGRMMKGAKLPSFGQVFFCVFFFGRKYTAP
jgi:hypothetical protein